MEKIVFSYELSEEAKKVKIDKVKKLMRNPQLQKWIQQYSVDESFVYDHSGKLSDYCDVMEKCEHCKGLDFCRQPQRGERLELKLDGFLMNELHACNYRINEKRQKEHQRYFCEADMAEAYLTIDLTQFDISKEQKEYKVAYDKAIDLILYKRTKGLYLWGKPGAGKTYLSAGIANYFAKEKKRVAFVNVPKLIADLKMMFQDHNAMDRKLKRIQRADVVILDDIGGESVTAWSRDDILLPLLDARMEDKKLTLFTSNYSMLELKQRLALTSNKMSEPVAAERLFERMRTLSDEIFIKGDSRRK